MKRAIFSGLTAGLALAIAAPTTAQATAQEQATAQDQAVPANPQIDYAGFDVLVGQLGPVRETHRLAWAEFARAARAEGALLLDARSPAAFARGHIAGAVNLR